MDQIYLAVRLAAAKLVQNGRDTMPLIFDDSFVLYDDERLENSTKMAGEHLDSQIVISPATSGGAASDRQPDSLQPDHHIRASPSTASSARAAAGRGFSQL